jgi:hypothetical protein
MAYRPPQKRGKTTSAPNALPVKDEYPQLAPVPIQTIVETKVETKAETKVETKPKMNFAALFKNVERKKRRAKKLKWGTILLTKNGIVDSLTKEEREYEEECKTMETQDKNLEKMCNRLIKTQNIRREYDANYESPEEWVESSSEEEEEEEEEVLTDEYEEDEFEPEI